MKKNTKLADNSMSGPLLADVECTHPFKPIRKLKHLGIGQGLARIAVTGLPVLLHGAPRELKILGDAFIGPSAINQMHDVADLKHSVLQASRVTEKGH